MPAVAVAVDRAVHLVLAHLELDGDRSLRSRSERLGLFLDAVALDLERVLGLAVVRRLERVGPGLVEPDRLRLSA